MSKELHNFKVWKSYYSDGLRMIALDFELSGKTVMNDYSGPRTVAIINGRWEYTSGK